MGVPEGRAENLRQATLRGAKGPKLFLKGGILHDFLLNDISID